MKYKIKRHEFGFWHQENEVIDVCCDFFVLPISTPAKTSSPFARESSRAKVETEKKLRFQLHGGITIIRCYFHLRYIGGLCHKLLSQATTSLKCL